MQGENDKNNPEKPEVRHFDISKKELIDIVQAYKQRKYDEDLVMIKSLGGPEELFRKLKTDPT